MRKWFHNMNLWELTDRMLFPSRRGKSTILWDKTISQSWFRKIIKTLADKAGYDGSKYSGHSLRAGGATDLFVSRVPYFLIKKMGRWKSDAAMLYYRCEEDLVEAVGGAFDGLAKLVGVVEMTISDTGFDLIRFS